MLRLAASRTVLSRRAVGVRSFRASAAWNETLDAPFISDTVPLAEGILGTVEELHCKPGDVVKEMEVIAVVESARADATQTRD
eukprot:7044074-Prymnesium_polylepis.1